MTGSFALFLPPLMLSTTLSYFASGVNTSIYRAQVLDRHIHQRMLRSTRGQ
ncbi:hypothetical protein [Thermogymnomonas acidicola]|uniref:hypothetical protein n=1 Tax=Thermogymnomonas acidicola TaxID=399579 RepID=UPI001494848C|nr:hypothetical protein [Thermogymnomonas acidicola]